MAFQYLHSFGRVQGTPEKKTQFGFQRISDTIQRRLFSKLMDFLDRI